MYACDVESAMNAAGNKAERSVDAKVVLIGSVRNSASPAFVVVAFVAEEFEDMG